MSTATDSFSDKLECTELVYLLARALDRRDETLLRSLFHDDATDDHGTFNGSASDFVTWVMPLLSGMERTQHCISNVLIDVVGDRAVGESYFVAHHDLKSPEGDPAHMIAAGRYLDRFERRDGSWKISHRHAIFEWNSWQPSTDGWDRSPQGARTYGTRGHADPLYAHLAQLKESAGNAQQ